MAEVALSRGLVALIDDADLPAVSAFKWFAKPADEGRSRFYAYRCDRDGGDRRTVHLHRELLNAPAGLMVDHINGDGLDNRRANLRLCTASQNLINRRYASASGFRGVHQEKSRWIAQIEVNGRILRCRGFATAAEAAKGYDALAKEYHADFAVLNFPRTA